MTVFEIKEKITNAIHEAVKEHGVTIDQINLEHPEVESFGDYFCNIAMRLSKTLKKNPMEIAQSVKDALELRITNYELRIVERIDIVKPGFINFWIKKEALLETIQKPFEFPKSGKKVMVEFTDPNPFKEFHIGHLYSNTVGEVLARLNESVGHDVKRACYQGDVGMHVAKSIWGILRKLRITNYELRINQDELKIKIQDLESRSIEDKQKFLGGSYSLGATEFEKNEEAKKEITILNKKIYDKDPEIYFLYEKGREWSLEYFETIYDRLGMRKNENEKHFNYYYFESKMGIFGLELVKEYLEKGIFEKSEGAVIFPGEKYGLHNRVFINSLGLPTYEAKELGLAPAKYQDFPYDLSVIVTGNEINEYFKVLLKALSLINPKLSEKTHHLGHGMVKLPTGKMSSRTGDVITGVWLLDEVKNKIKTDYKCDEETAEKIGLSAIKYALLKSGLGKDVIFDLEKSIAVEGNSGPYLQYALVRTKSVKSKITNYELRITNFLNNLAIKQFNNEELSLVRTLYQFPEVVKSAAENYAPNLLCNFLYDLAQKFNTFYGKHRIVDEDRVNEFRLFLTQKTGEVLESGMKILNLPIVEKM
jgi:arginyl-tRNA synthetase